MATVQTSPFSLSPSKTENVSDVILEDLPQRHLKSELKLPPEDEGEENNVMAQTRSRRRAAPTKFSDGPSSDEEMEEVSPPQSPIDPPVKKVSSSIPAKRKRQPIRGNWSADHLLTNPNSKLADSRVDLLKLLKDDDASWTALSRDQQMELVMMLPGASLPDGLPEDEPLPNLLAQSLRENQSFQEDVRFFQEDLAAGKYEPKWLEDAQNAMEKRADGKFDDWKEKHREAFWGQKQRMDWTAPAGESSLYSLSDLVKAGYFKVGDIFLLRRGLRQEDAKTLYVEKEATVTSISSSHSLSFTYPPKQSKFSASANGEEKTITEVEGPKQLSDAILSEDGRIVGVRGPNSWKEFRCFRNNQDMGSLWDIRELYHSRLGVKSEQ